VGILGPVVMAVVLVVVTVPMVVVVIVPMVVIVIVTVIVAIVVVAVAVVVAIVMVGRFSQDALPYIMDIQFSLAAREDMTVSFVLPSSGEALYSLRALPGVRYAEPFRLAAARVRRSVLLHPSNQRL
jgi:hypothetical protein